jgi:tetratricopeptide (TPR) repeat protein
MSSASVPSEAATELILAVGAEPTGYEEALVWGRHAVAELDPSDDGRERADISTHLGNAASIAGRFDESLAHYDSALQLREQALGAEHLATAGAHLNRAAALVLVGRYAEGLEAHQRGLAIVVEQAGTDHRFAIIARSNVGDTLRTLGRNRESRQYLTEALALGRAALEPLDEQIGLTLGSLALTEAGLVTWRRRAGSSATRSRCSRPWTRSTTNWQRSGRTSR